MYLSRLNKAKRWASLARTARVRAHSQNSLARHGPTSRVVKVKGAIGSLLEVGTGFHPELTGRENIYLNGAILGMKKAEVARKFDEIVDFSGVESSSIHRSNGTPAAYVCAWHSQLQPPGPRDPGGG